MIRWTKLRRALLKILEVVDNAFVVRVTNMNVIDVFLRYVCMLPVVGCLGIIAGRWFTPLIFIGLIILITSPCIPLLAYVLDRFFTFLNRERTYCGNQFPAVLYWETTELLEARGISNPNKYLRKHPDHSNALIQTMADLHNMELDEWNKIVALVYNSDDNPAATGKAISTILEERGDMPANDVKALLEIRGETSSPLMDGVL